VILGKLSAYRRKNRTKRTPLELDNIIRDLSLLDYIASLALRRNAQRALNRGEVYHELRPSIADALGGRFRARSQHELEIWSERSRLVGNAVVYYNVLILPEALAELESRGKPTSAEILKRVSSVPWYHISFCGRYPVDVAFPPIDFTRLR
jgi:TnpA family transposase